MELKADIMTNQVLAKHAKSKWKITLAKIKKYKVLYLLIIPVLTWFIIFGYIPMYGITLAFKDFSFKRMLFSPWLTHDTFKYFRQFFTYFQFWDLMRNTLVISMLSLILGFPAPILLALLLNEIRNMKFKKTIQTISYMPHFVSWVVVIGIMQMLLSPHSGVINGIRESLNMESIYFLNEPKYFYGLLLGSRIWKEIGWSSIIYLAALSAINPELYESAGMDGANRLKQAWYISLPGIRPTIAILLILSLGGILNAGWEQIYLMKTPGTATLANVLDVYVVDVGLSQGQYGYATAVGLFKGVIGLILITIANKIVRNLTESSLW